MKNGPAGMEMEGISAVLMDEHVHLVFSAILTDLARIVYVVTTNGFRARLGDEELPSWLRVDRLLGEHGIQEDSTTRRRGFEERIEEHRKQETDGAEWKPATARLVPGVGGIQGQAPRADGRQVGEHHPGTLKREGPEAKAERTIGEELKRWGWTERDLKVRAKSDPAKLALAARVRRETTLTLGWMAKLLQPGTRKSSGAKLPRWRKANEKHSK